jgi:predicted outer membrane repeat protein
VANTVFAVQGGGGLYQGNYPSGTGAVTLTSPELTGNRAALGGGLYLSAGRSVTVRNGTVSGNTATTTGGGVFAEAGATLNRQMTRITGNTPDNCAGAVSC